LTIALFGLAIAGDGIIWRFLGWIAGAAGLGLIVGGVLTRRDGFAGSPFQTVALLLFVAVTIGLLVAGFLTRERE
jgi:Ca2+/H+ antiporter